MQQKSSEWRKVLIPNQTFCLLPGIECSQVKGCSLFNWEIQKWRHRVKDSSSKGFWEIGRNGPPWMFGLLPWNGWCMLRRKRSTEVGQTKMVFGPKQDVKNHSPSHDLGGKRKTESRTWINSKLFPASQCFHHTTCCREMFGGTEHGVGNNILSLSVSLFHFELFKSRQHALVKRGPILRSAPIKLFFLFTLFVSQSRQCTPQSFLSECLPCYYWPFLYPIVFVRLGLLCQVMVVPLLFRHWDWAFVLVPHIKHQSRFSNTTLNLELPQWLTSVIPKGHYKSGLITTLSPHILSGTVKAWHQNRVCFSFYISQNRQCSHSHQIWCTLGVATTGLHWKLPGATQSQREPFARCGQALRPTEGPAERSHIAGPVLIIVP